MEGDLAFYYQVDVRDHFRPHGGRSRLTLRRLLVLADRLPPESAFKSVLDDRIPISDEVAQLARLEEIWTGKKAPIWSAKKRARDRYERAAKMQILAPVAQERNNKYLEARRKRLAGRIS